MKPEKQEQEPPPGGTVHTGAQVLIRLAGVVAAVIAIILIWKFLFG
jgi:hypothetical protein